MAKYENKAINTLLTDNKDSVSSDFKLNKLRTLFDSNYNKWKSLPPGDHARQLLADENLKIIDLIIAGC